MVPVASSTLPEYSSMKSLDAEVSEYPSENKTEMFALYISTSRLCSLPRVEINNRLVIIGASNTGLSFLENLIFNFDHEQHVLFNNLTLLHDHTMRETLDITELTRKMFVYRGKYGPNHFNSVCFRCHVNYIHGFMVEINR